MESRLYEAMFLVDAAHGGSELPDVIRHISGLLERHDARIEQIQKWDERKLAYKIKGTRRGIYILAHFRCDPSRVEELRRAIQLSEQILRVLILTAEDVPAPTGELFSPEGEEVEEEPEEAAGAGAEESD